MHPEPLWIGTIILVLSPAAFREYKHLKVARTIADLAGSEHLTSDHVLEVWDSATARSSGFSVRVGHHHTRLDLGVPE